MADRMILESGKISVTTEEGVSLETTEATLRDIMAQVNSPPLGGQLLPDGVKGMFWDPPHLVVVHQASPKVLPVAWITDDSPVDFGPGTQYRKVRLSFPYAITFASFVQFRGGLQLTGHNELYFRNQPVRCEADALGFPALLNVSYIDAGDRVRSWICTQHLDRHGIRDWCGQLQALLNHTWNGAFNRSSERHEGQSMYQFSADTADLHPVARWEEASGKNPAFALGVPWKPAPLGVGDLARKMLAELASQGNAGLFGPRPRRVPIMTRLVRHLLKQNPPENGDEK
jgi:hypothetical protein